MAAGAASILGTILAAIVVSNAIRPFYVLRYIYPVSVVAWAILAVIVSRLRGKRLYAVLLLAYMLAVFSPAYMSRYRGDRAANERLQETLAATVEEIGAEDIILTNISHIGWTIAPYYYPENTAKSIDLSALPDLEKGVVYWLIVKDGQEMEGVREALGEQGFSSQKVFERGNLGTHPVTIYRIADF